MNFCLYYFLVTFGWSRPSISEISCLVNCPQLGEICLLCLNFKHLPTGLKLQILDTYSSKTTQIPETPAIKTSPNLYSTDFPTLSTSISETTQRSKIHDQKTSSDFPIPENPVIITSPQFNSNALTSQPVPISETTQRLEIYDPKTSLEVHSEQPIPNIVTTPSFSRSQSTSSVPFKSPIQNLSIITEMPISAEYDFKNITRHLMKVAVGNCSTEQNVPTSKTTSILEFLLVPSVWIFGFLMFGVGFFMSKIIKTRCIQIMWKFVLSGVDWLMQCFRETFISRIFQGPSRPGYSGTLVSDVEIDFTMNYGHQNYRDAVSFHSIEMHTFH